jgi:putative membrane protein
MWYGMDGWGWGMMGMGMLFMVLFWVLVLLGIVALVKWLIGPSSGVGRRPLDIIKERYAKGELTKEQFEQMKRDLQ